MFYIFGTTVPSFVMHLTISLTIVSLSAPRYGTEWRPFYDRPDFCCPEFSSSFLPVIMSLT